MKVIHLALRNVFRNRRRSLITMTAIAVGAAAVILFGGYVVGMVLGIQTSIVSANGHLHVYAKGYMEDGAADPLAYSMGGYRQVMDTIKKDPWLGPRINVITPFLRSAGIAGNFKEESSVTFFGKGVVAADREKMKKWNPFGIGSPPGSDEIPPLDHGDSEAALIGRSMARNLSLCDELKVKGCRDKESQRLKAAAKQNEGVGGEAPLEDLSFLTEVQAQQAQAPGELEDLSFLEEVKNDPRAKVDETGPGPATLDLMAATAGGSANVVSVKVTKAADFGERMSDNHFVLMHLSHAQQLVFGRGEPKVTGVIIQLKNTWAMTPALKRVKTLIAQNRWNLEVHDLSDVAPIYIQVLGMMGTIFGFMAVIMGAIVVFTVANTMRMSVMERVSEIGTLRSMGLKRAGIMKLFVWEGAFLGLLGASAGVVLAAGAAVVFNQFGFSWVPPMRVTPVYIYIKIFEYPLLIPLVWLTLAGAAVFSSWWPARAAARMAVVDALRHN